MVIIIHLSYFTIHPSRRRDITGLSETGEYVDYCSILYVVAVIVSSPEPFLMRADFILTRCVHKISSTSGASKDA